MKVQIHMLIKAHSINKRNFMEEQILQNLNYVIVFVQVVINIELQMITNYAYHV